MTRGLAARIVRAYDRPLVRAYARIRFLILRRRLLEEIGQYLPREGTVLDIGCGFGPFALYFALGSPNRLVTGVDRDARRIETARRAARALALENASFEVADVRDVLAPGRVAAAYMIDLLHHVPAGAVEPLLRSVRQGLAPGSRLLIKDIARHPAPKRWFTFWLDKVMAPTEPVHYWAAPRLESLLEKVGFRVWRHAMNDVLPYSHVLYVCEAVA